MAVDLAALELELERELQRYDDSISSHSFNFTALVKSPDATIALKAEAGKPGSKYSPFSLSTPLQPQCTSNMHSARSLAVTNSGSIYYPPAPGEENTAPVNSSAKSTSSAYLANRRKFDSSAMSPDKDTFDRDGEEELLQDRLHDLHVAQSAARAESRSFHASMAEHEQRFSAFKREQGQLRRENAHLKKQLSELRGQGQGQGQGAGVGTASGGAETGRVDVSDLSPKQSPSRPAGACTATATATATEEEVQWQKRCTRLEAEVAQLSAVKEDYRLALEAEIKAGAVRDAKWQMTVARQEGALSRLQQRAEQLKGAALQEARRAAVAAQQRDAVRAAYEKVKARLIGSKSKTKP